jgi:hypothetical protein
MPDLSSRSTENWSVPPASDRVDGAGADASAARAPIGAPLRALIDELQGLAGRLEPLASRTEAAELAQLRLDLERQICRIAVVGQVKAGKSSLINALVRRAGLSPANINPWTAVVAKFHFGAASADGAKAVFSFFDEDDWRHLAAGGRLQELSSRIGAPVPLEMLAEQVGQMRQRAEQRLGRQFHHLLGQQHRYAAATAEIIARYVCVGEEAAAGAGRPAPMTGRFSDITKAADLYLDLAPFAVPTVLIDTPGTNDPFLVRDDLTRQTLDRADAYIVVLTAQQAFSTTDLAILRLLHGLHKQRLVAFVNRIDLLADLAGDTERVLDHVRRRLAQEFPEAEIPVIAGSAHWGELALAAGGAPAGARLPPALPDDPAAAPAATLAACSGLPALEAALSRLLLGGPAMLGLRRALATVLALQARLDAKAGSDLQGLADMARPAGQDQAGMERRLAGLERQIRALGALPRELDSAAGALEGELSMLVEAALCRLRIGLAGVVQAFANAQAEALRAALRGRRDVRIWQCDTLPLRRELEQSFLRIYRHAAAELQAADHRALDQLGRAIGRLLPDQRIALDWQQVHLIDPAPSISALGQTVALDLGEQWAQWWQLWRTPTQRLRRLQEVILAEFEAVANALVDAAAAELAGHVGVTVERHAAAQRTVLEALKQRQARLAGLRQELLAERDGSTAAMVERFRTRHRQQIERLERCRAIGAALRDLAARCAAPAPARSERDQDAV